MLPKQRTNKEKLCEHENTEQLGREQENKDPSWEILRSQVTCIEFVLKYTRKYTLRDEHQH